MESETNYFVGLSMLPVFQSVGLMTEYVYLLKAPWKLLEAENRALVKLFLGIHLQLKNYCFLKWLLEDGGVLLGNFSVAS